MKKASSNYTIAGNCLFMLRHGWQWEKKIVLFSICWIVFSVAEHVLTLFAAPRILSLIQEKASVGELIRTILFFILSLMIARSIIEYCQENYIFGKIIVRSGFKIRLRQAFAHTSYPNTEDPEALKKLTAAMEATQRGSASATETIWHSMSDLVLALICFLFYLYLLTDLNLLLAIVVIVTTAASFLISRRLNSWEYRHRNEKAGHLRKMTYVEKRTADLTFGKDIRLFGMQQWLEDVYASSLRMFRRFIDRSEKSVLLGTTIDALLTVLRNGFAYYYLIHRVLAGTMNAPQFVLYFAAFTGFSAWVSQIMESALALQRDSLTISQFREYDHIEEPFLLEEGKPIDRAMLSSCEFRLEHVSFRYPGAEEDTLHDINLTVHPGEKIAVVGLNGAGKTTLIKLILGLYDPTEGRVLLNGTDIRVYNRNAYYTLFSALFQQMTVMDVTLAENVAQIPEDEIDREKLTDCLEKAGLLQKVKDLPKGADTPIGKKIFDDGIELSGGETQRLMLARALYKDAPVLVLDEPTAALDPIAEDRLYHQYQSMTAGKTSFFVSHRLASTRFCDRILLIEDHRIKEQGTHTELINAGGSYARLFEVQSRYYKEGEEEGHE